MKKVEQFRISNDGKKYLKRIKALAMIKKTLLAKKQQAEMQASMLDVALQETHKGLLQATQVPGEQLTHDMALMEEDHA